MPAPARIQEMLSRLDCGPNLLEPVIGVVGGVGDVQEDQRVRYLENVDGDLFRGDRECGFAAVFELAGAEQSVERAER